MSALRSVRGRWPTGFYFVVSILPFGPVSLAAALSAAFASGALAGPFPKAARMFSAT